MKKTIYLLPLAFLILILFSCSKENVEEKITGEWKLTERYNSTINGGDSSWSVLPVNQQSFIEFGEDGTFTEKISDSSATIQCTGTYVEIKKNQYQVQSTCRQAPYSISAIITNHRLIISYPDRDTKEKYLRLR